MTKLRNYLTLVLCVLLIASLLSIIPTNAQTITKPSVPEFTERYVDYSYDVPPTYGIDKFTGKETIITTANPSTSKPISLTEPTPLIPPSTSSPAENYSVPPLSSLSLTIHLTYGEPCGLFLYVAGGSGDDINFKIINPEGKIIFDLGRISNETSFKFYADKTGNFTIMLDNEFSVFSSKEVNVRSSNPFTLFEFAGYSINCWMIIFVAILFVTLIALVVWLIRRKRK